MANIKSAEKANRQRVKRTKANHARKSAMRTAIKKFKAAVGSPKAPEALKEAMVLIDRAGGRGVIKKGTASRLVSRLTKAAARASAPASQ